MSGILRSIFLAIISLQTYEGNQPNVDFPIIEGETEAQKTPLGAQSPLIMNSRARIQTQAVHSACAQTPCQKASGNKRATHKNRG